MAKYYYNGVLLPEIPANVLAAYPYRIIFLNIESKYRLIAAEQPWYWNVRTSPSLFIDAICNNVSYSLSDDNTEWTFSAKYTDQGSWSPEEIVWASFDIPYADPDGTEIHFEGSDPVPEEPEKPEYAERYSILGSILVGTARQIMRLTDSTKKVKPEEFEPKLEGINIQLQELTVTATEEVQTITPPSGVYGFSKVIVEAVEDSGSSGGGGTPGEGGEGGEGTEDNYVSSDYVQFGAEITELPTPPDDGNLYYIIFTYADGGTYLATSGARFTAYNHTHGNHMDLQIKSDGGNDLRYSLGDGWGSPVSNVWPVAVSCNNAGTDYQSDYYGAVLFTNHDILFGDEVWMEGMETESDSVALTIETPVERDETYTIEGNKLNDLILTAQKITGTNEPMTPDEAIEALQTYQNQPTAEELTF